MTYKMRYLIFWKVYLVDRSEMKTTKWHFTVQSVFKGSASLQALLYISYDYVTIKSPFHFTVRHYKHNVEQKVH